MYGVSSRVFCFLVAMESEDNGGGGMHASTGSSPLLACGSWEFSETARSNRRVPKMTWRRVDVSPPACHEIRVKLFAAGVNPLDAQKCSSAPSGAGLEGAGIVESVGSAATQDLRVGDHVVLIAAETGGTFREYVTVSADCVVRINHHLLTSPTAPSDSLRHIDYVEAACIPVAGTTAYIALMEKLKVERGGSIYIHGGTGGVGMFAVQLARMMGMYVIASCSTTHQFVLTALGADIVVDYSTEKDIARAVLLATGNYGVDYAMDCSSGSSVCDFARMIRFGGGVCIVSNSKQQVVCSEVAWQRQLSIQYFSLLDSLTSQRGRETWREAAGKMLEWYSTGMYDVLVEEVDLRQAPLALEVVLEGHTLGKLVLYKYDKDLEKEEAIRRAKSQSYIDKSKYVYR